MVIKASVNGKATEGTCNNLEKAPSGMTVRTYLNEALSVTQLFDLERQLQLQLQADLPAPFVEKTAGCGDGLSRRALLWERPDLVCYACRGEAHQGTTWFYRVATVYVIHHQVPYTLGIVFLLPEYRVGVVVQALLWQVAGLKLPCSWSCIWTKASATLR